MAQSSEKTDTEQEDRFQDAELKTDAASETSPESLAAQEPSSVEEVLQELERKYQDLYDQYLRLSADFDNYRKRTREEQESLVKYGAQKTALELLPVLDNLERATATLSESSDAKVLYQSFRMMYNQIMEGFSALGVKKIQAVGQPFDPQYHEAVSQVESEHPENTVAAEMQSGYMLNDKVLRPALVTVSTGSVPAGPAAPQQAEETPHASPQSSDGAQKANPFRK